MDLSIAFLNENLYFKKKNEDVPIIKMHFPEKQLLEDKFQTAKGNRALLIGVSQYKTKGDRIYADLPLAKNDVVAIRDFLLESLVEFKKEHITILIDPSTEELK